MSATVVVKIGGRALDAPGALPELADALGAHVGPCVVVHGGGAEVSAWCERLGLEPRFEDGLRVTDPATLEVATAVLAGLANKRLVAALREVGFDAVGLSAVDGGIATAAPHPDAGRLGEVGGVRAVSTSLIETLHSYGYLPVIASIAALGSRLLNINADELAAAVAAAIEARVLVLLSDTPGLMLDGARVPRLSPAGLDAALTHPDVQGGMRPKLEAARTAIRAGVSRVHIMAWEGPAALADVLAEFAPAFSRQTGLAPGTTIHSTPRAEVAGG